MFLTFFVLLQGVLVEGNDVIITGRVLLPSNLEIHGNSCVFVSVGKALCVGNCIDLVETKVPVLIGNTSVPYKFIARGLNHSEQYHISGRLHLAGCLGAVESQSSEIKHYTDRKKFFFLNNERWLTIDLTLLERDLFLNVHVKLESRLDPRDSCVKFYLTCVQCIVPYSITHSIDVADDNNLIYKLDVGRLKGNTTYSLSSSINNGWCDYHRDRVPLKFGDFYSSDQVFFHKGANRISISFNQYKQGELCNGTLCSANEVCVDHVTCECSPSICTNRGNNFASISITTESFLVHEFHHDTLTYICVAMVLLALVAVVTTTKFVLVWKPKGDDKVFVTSL